MIVTVHPFNSDTAAIINGIGIGQTKKNTETGNNNTNKRTIRIKPLCSAVQSRPTRGKKKKKKERKNEVRADVIIQTEQQQQLHVI